MHELKRVLLIYMRFEYCESLTDFKSSLSTIGCYCALPMCDSYLIDKHHIRYNYKECLQYDQ